MTERIVLETVPEQETNRITLDLSRLSKVPPTRPVGSQVFVVYEVVDEVYPAIVRRYVRSGTMTLMGVMCINEGFRRVDVYTFPGKTVDRIWREHMVEEKGYDLGVVLPMIGWFVFDNVFNGIM